MKRFLLLLALALPLAAHAQFVEVRDFPGVTVAARLTKAMATCQSPVAAGLPCILILAPEMKRMTEGTLPTLCAQCSLLDWRTGSIGFNAATVKDPYFDLRALGPVTHTNDTATLAAWAAAVSGSGPAAQAKTGKGFCPDGIYPTTQTVIFYGDPFQAVDVGGNVTGRGPSGCVIKYIGPYVPGRPVVKTIGLNQSRIHDIGIDANGLADVGLQLSNTDGVGDFGSSGITVERVTITGMRTSVAPNTVNGVVLGQSPVVGNGQVSEVVLRNVVIQGSGTPGTRCDNGIYAAVGGNTKNFLFEFPTMNACVNGINQDNPNDSTMVIYPVFANITGWDIRTGGPIFVQGGESEDLPGSGFLRAVEGAAVASQVVVTNFHWSSQWNITPATGDVAVICQANCSFTGNVLRSNNAAHPARVQVNGPGVVGGSPTGDGYFGNSNAYQFASVFAPIVDGSGNNWFTRGSSTSIVSMNEVGGDDGAVVHLPNFYGAPLVTHSSLAGLNLYFAGSADGTTAHCDNCDTPAPAAGAVCTAAGDHAGAQAIFQRGNWLCF